MCEKGRMSFRLHTNLATARSGSGDQSASNGDPMDYKAKLCELLGVPMDTPDEGIFSAVLEVARYLGIELPRAITDTGGNWGSPEGRDASVAGMMFANSARGVALGTLFANSAEQTIRQRLGLTVEQWNRP